MWNEENLINLNKVKCWLILMGKYSAPLRKSTIQGHLCEDKHHWFGFTSEKFESLHVLASINSTTNVRARHGNKRDIFKYSP